MRDRDAAAQLAVRPSELMFTSSPSVSLMLLTTVQRCSGSTGGAPTRCSSPEASTALVRSAGSSLALGNTHLAVGLDAVPVELEIELRRGVDACFGHVHHAQILAFHMQGAVGLVVAPAAACR